MPTKKITLLNGVTHLLVTGFFEAGTNGDEYTAPTPPDFEIECIDVNGVDIMDTLIELGVDLRSIENECLNIITAPH